MNAILEWKLSAGRWDFLCNGRRIGSVSSLPNDKWFAWWVEEICRIPRVYRSEKNAKRAVERHFRVRIT